MTTHPEVTFIICTYNRDSYLEDTLISLLATPAGCYPRFQVLVVDNNSTDKTPEIVTAFRESHPDMNLSYVREDRQGLSHARNRGIVEALAECVVFLDDDIRATPQLIPAWLSFFSNYSTAVAGGGKIHVQFDDPRPAWMSHFLLPLLGHHDLGNRFKKYPLNSYPFGGNMGFRKHLFETYGTFKTNLGRKGKELNASEEKELFRRIRTGEQEIYYLPEALLYHRVNKSRLTVDYIRQQALGLGRSIAVQLQYASFSSKIMAGFQECFKFVVSLGLFLPYMFTFQSSKAVMLLKFRKWIVKGYFSK